MTQNGDEAVSLTNYLNEHGIFASQSDTNEITLVASLTISGAILIGGNGPMLEVIDKGSVTESPATTHISTPSSPRITDRGLRGGDTGGGLAAERETLQAGAASL